MILGLTAACVTSTDERLQKAHEQAVINGEQYRAEQAVRITRNPQATAGCQFLRNFDVEGDENDLEHQMRVKAVSIKANLVFVAPVDKKVWNPMTGFFGNSSNLHGEAYLCEQPKP